MIIPRGKYRVENPKVIYKTGENRRSGREFDHWMSFQDGKMFTLETEENRIVAIHFDMDIQVDPENGTITFN
jgi:hypothetical protein